jgi:hypothetical protein
MRSTTHVVTTAMLITILSSHSVAAQTTAELWRSFAQRVSVGTELTVHLNDGRRVRATLVDVRDDAVLLQPKTRIAVPVQAVPFDAIVRMEPRKPGLGTGKAIAIGVATGVGTFFGIMAVLLTIVGD